MSRKRKLDSATVLKREANVEEDDHLAPDQQTQALFRHIFEQHYTPLEDRIDHKDHSADNEHNSDAESSDSEWSGLTEPQESSTIVVVDHTISLGSKGPAADLDSYKTYMVGTNSIYHKMCAYNSHRLPNHPNSRPRPHRSSKDPRNQRQPTWTNQKPKT